MHIPIVKVELKLLSTAEYINESEHTSYFILNINDVPEGWQHEATLSLGNEVQASGLFAILKDVRLLYVECRHQERAHPRHKGVGFIFEVRDILVPLFVDEQVHRYLQLLGQHLDQVSVLFVDEVLELKAKRHLYFLVELFWQVVLLLNAVQLLKFGDVISLLLVVVRQDGRERSVCEGKRDDSNDHHARTEHPFSKVVGHDVSVPHRCDCCDGPVE